MGLWVVQVIGGGFGEERWLAAGFALASGFGLESCGSDLERAWVTSGFRVDLSG